MPSSPPTNTKISLSLARRKVNPPPSRTTKTTTAPALHDPDHTSDSPAPPPATRITHFDRRDADRFADAAGGNAPLVIPPLPNRDWRAAAEGVKRRRVALAAGEKEEDAAPTPRAASDDDGAGITDRHAAAELLGAGPGPAADGASTPLILDPGPGFAGPAAADPTGRNDATPPSAADYARVPVEEFGAGLLRGMGWRGEVGATGTGEEVRTGRRAALLGIGAKEEVGMGETGGRGRGRGKVYVPVVERGRGGAGRAWARARARLEGWAEEMIKRHPRSVSPINLKCAPAPLRSLRRCCA